MKERDRNKTIKLIRIIIVILFIGLLSASIAVLPITMRQATHLSANSRIAVYQTKNNECYRLSVEKGHQYEFYIYISTYWEVDMIFKLYSGPAMLIGMKADRSDFYGEHIEFIAKHDGSYYLIISSAKGSAFEILFYENNHPYLDVYPVSVNPWRVGTLAIFTSLLIICFVIQNQVQKQNSEISKKEGKKVTCPQCNALIGEENGYCEYCGKTFIEPKEINFS